MLRRTSAAAVALAATLAGTPAGAEDPVPVSCSVSIEWEGCTYFGVVGPIGKLTVSVTSGDAYGIVSCTYGGTGLWQYGPGTSSIEFVRAGYCVVYFTGPAVATVSSN